jgi:hypothetical protein
MPNVKLFCLARFEKLPEQILIKDIKVHCLSYYRLICTAKQKLVKQLAYVVLAIGNIKYSSLLREPTKDQYFNGLLVSLCGGGLATRASRRLLIPGWGRQMNLLPALRAFHFLRPPASASKTRPRPGIKNAPRTRGNRFTCGEEGIRTLDTLSSIHTFQACSFNHSDTSPGSTLQVDRSPACEGGKSTISRFNCRIFFGHWPW